MADQYPAGLLSLRSSSPETIVLRTESETEGSRTVGTVDWASACWMVHPEAVYMHAGQSFMVEKLDLDTHSALLSVFDGDYFTQPQSETMVELVQIGQFEKTPADEKYFGDIKVTTRVKGFRKVRWYTNENLGEGLLDLPPSELITNGYWLALTDQTVAQLREQGLWNSEPNRYGPGWEKLRDIVRRRDRFICQACGIPENGKQHHVHHKTPFRTYTSIEEANRLDNLITLCPHCHQRAEVNLRIKSGLSGLGYVLHQLASFFLMCDQNDLGVLSDPNSVLAEGKPVVAIYDMVPAGIGLSKALYDTDQKILRDCLSLVKDCPCTSGCPSCVGPGGENGLGGKQETLAILEALTGDR
jgi:DEAD/DEAH box helicase domain-containing protein